MRAIQRGTVQNTAEQQESWGGPLMLEYTTNFQLGPLNIELSKEDALHLEVPTYAYVFLV